MILANIKTNLFFQKGELSTTLTPYTANFVELVNRPSKAFKSKDEIPLLNLAINIAEKGTKRAGYDFGGVTCLVLDYDGGLTFDDFMAQYGSTFDDLEYVAHATSRNTAEKPKWRMIVPLTTAINTDDWMICKDHLKRLFPEADHTSWDVFRGFKIPAIIDPSYEYWSAANEGLSLDIMKLLGLDYGVLALLKAKRKVALKTQEVKWRARAEKYAGGKTRSVINCNVPSIGMTIAQWLGTNWSHHGGNGGKRTTGAFACAMLALRANDMETFRLVNRHAERCGVRVDEKKLYANM